jgi:OmcA/MtrC family decaheme c-type cytochrome
MTLMAETVHGNKDNPHTPYATHGCESCHGPGSFHSSRARGGVGFPALISFRRGEESGQVHSQACTSCHGLDLGEKKGMKWDGSLHEISGMTCVSCHQLHVADDRMKDQQLQTEQCSKCHSRKIAVHKGADLLETTKCSRCHKVHELTRKDDAPFTAVSLMVNISEPTFESGKLTFKFAVEDQNGRALAGITDVHTTLAKLVSDESGYTTDWNSYLRKATDISSEQFPDANNVSLPTADNGELIDNLDGTYQYTFTTDVLNGVDPVTGEAIAWQDSLTHRVGLEIRKSNDYPVANATFDWVPSGGDVNLSRQIVTVESCNNCHTELTSHDGNSTDTDNCVTCHNPGANDPISGESLDFKIMIHKLHQGIDLPTLSEVGNKYSLFTHNGTEETIFAENDGIWVLNNKGTIDGIDYPQDIRNCTGCHADDADSVRNPNLQGVITSEGGNWKHIPSVETCSSCHDNTAFNEEMLAAKPNSKKHVMFPSENDSCLFCHGEGQDESVENVHTVAALGKKSAGIDYGVKFEVTHLEASSATAYDVHIRVTKDGAGITLNDEFLQYRNSVRLLMNWDNGAGFETHVARNTPNSFELDENPLCQAGASVGDIICQWDTALDPNINGGEPLTSGDILTTFISSGVCVDSRNQLVNCEDNNALERISTPSTVINNFFDAATLTYNPDFELKFGANFNKCDSCHEQVIQHDSRRSDDPSQCKACHNANRFTRSPADSPRDGGSSDLKFEVHKIHSNFRFVDAENDFVMVGRNEFYSAPISDCAQCHDEQQINLPLAQNPRASITRAPTTSLSDGNNLVRDGAVYTSPIALVCSSCHLSVGPGLIGADGKVVPDADGNTLLTRDLSSNGPGYDNGEFPQVPVTITEKEKSMLNHMILIGGAVFGATSEAAATGTESCSTCHSIGSSTGVDKVHVNVASDRKKDQQPQMEQCSNCHSRTIETHDDFSNSGIVFERLSCSTCHDEHQF